MTLNTKIAFIHSLHPHSTCFFWYHKSFTRREKGHFEPNNKEKSFLISKSKPETTPLKHRAPKINHQRSMICQIKAACRPRHICFNLCFLVMCLHWKASKQNSTHNKKWTNVWLKKVTTSYDTLKWKWIFSNPICILFKGIDLPKCSFCHHLLQTERLSSVECNKEADVWHPGAVRLQKKTKTPYSSYDSCFSNLQKS